jgi:hypothetical protein
MLLWFTLIWTLLVAGPLSYFANVSRADWIVYASAFVFWFIAGISAFSSSKKSPHQEVSKFPGYLVALILFYILNLANSLYQLDGVMQLFVGIKNYFLFFGLTLTLAAAVFSINTLRRVAVGILIIGLIQLPVALYQFIFIRSDRIDSGGGTIGDSLVEASDVVVGTMGGQVLRGGLDDVLALLSPILLAGLLTAWRQNLLPTGRTIALSILVIAPVFLTETKVIFFYFPVVALVVSWDYLRRRPHALAMTALVAPLVLAVGLAGYYQLHWSKQYENIEVAVEKSFTYSFAEQAGEARARSSGEMTRREAVEYWWTNHDLSQPDTLFLGHGLAASKQQSTVVLPKTVREHGGRNLAKTGLSQLLWDAGLIGTLLFFGVLLAASHRAAKLSQTGEPMDRVILKAIQAGLLLMALSLLYRSSLLNTAQAGFPLFLMLGMVAYYDRFAKKSALSESGVKG